jgi:hypothetical protein
LVNGILRNDRCDGSVNWAVTAVKDPETPPRAFTTVTVVVSAFRNTVRVPASDVPMSNDPDIRIMPATVIGTTAVAVAITEVIQPLCSVKLPEK